MNDFELWKAMLERAEIPFEADENAEWSEPNSAQNNEYAFEKSKGKIIEVAPVQEYSIFPTIVFYFDEDGMFTDLDAI